MHDFFYILLTYSGTALSIFLFFLGWLVKSFIAEKSKVLGWVVFILFCALAVFCLLARNILFTDSMGLR